ncbi:MAG: T9SS type A sorting domain-containing protein [Saprospiraceae bacterium]|nr:T9SS type A sorting domain-containing protein [Saprospiraceae bacterium]
MLNPAVLSTIVFFYSTGILSAQQRIDKTLYSESEKREYIVALPSDQAPIGGFPVVFMFHGTGGDGEKFYQISGWKENALANDFIAVFPSALRYCLIEDGQQNRTTKWNCKDLSENLCSGQQMKDDVLFFEQMLDSLKSEFEINPCKIYVSGFSNGSCFGSKLSVKLGHKIAAYGGVGGFMGIDDTLQNVVSAPLWLMVGTKDNRFTEGFGIKEFPFNDSILIYFNGAVQRYLYSLQLKHEYTKEELPNALTYRFNTSIHPNKNAEFKFTLIKNLTHQYPNGNNFPVNISQIFWDYFKDLCQLVDAEEIAEKRSYFQIYPNPSLSGDLIIESETTAMLDLYHLSGENLISGQWIQSGLNKIKLNLSPGFYFLKIYSGKHSHIEKLMVN